MSAASLELPALRTSVTDAKRWVVKIGSALLTNDGQGLALESIADWVEQLAQLRKQGHQIILVSSGAVAAGMERLSLKTRPTQLPELQAAAAIGQMRLIQCYESLFQQQGIGSAQVLLTHDDLADRRRYLNARSTFSQLLDYGVVPIVNENDTVVTEEICFGDNDMLAALVANLMSADLLVILTDQKGLYTANPQLHPDAELVPVAKAGDPALLAMTSGSGTLGRGGMASKVKAAAVAARSGTNTLVTSGRQSQVLLRLKQGEALGTLFFSDEAPLLARKRWLAGHLQVRGQVQLDAGAVLVLTQQGRSLLPVGVTDCRGEFERGELVSCIAPDGQEVARGLINYSQADVRQIQGKASHQIDAILGYSQGPELIHRDNLILM